MTMRPFSLEVPLLLMAQVCFILVLTCANVNLSAPDGKSPGIVNVYPGLCNKNDWPACETGTLLAIAVAADYANDQLLTNWTKPSFNPIMENTQRDPSSAWKTPFGDWRFRTYNSHVYGAVSEENVSHAYGSNN
eukprot:m.311871 g.311871  ORF g.311871 m.311871 type:complete len:134 (+) comp16482_c0_seq67:741-1142(+)